MMDFNVLIIDDDPVTVFLHKTLVSKSGLTGQPYCFTSAVHAWEFLTSFSDKSSSLLLLLDINMPGMSGWDLVENISNASRGNVEILIISSSINIADMKRAESYHHVKGYIAKPLTVDKLKRFFEARSVNNMSKWFHE